MKALSLKLVHKAFGELDHLLPTRVELLVGGGIALVANYGETEATRDVDAIPLKSKLSFEELKPYLLQVAESLDLPKDWVNPYFQTFTFVLPEDYLSRTQVIYEGTNLRCLSLGPEDLLIMKLTAGRKKDDRHIRRLLRWSDIDLSIVEKRLEEFKQLGVKGGKEALDRFDEYRSDLGLSEKQ